VGSRGGYKNFSGLLKAFATSPKLKNEFDIVTFGGGAFNKQELQLIKQLGFKNHQVRQIGGGDDILAALYHQAAAFVYPSLYEGFGLPPLEAMAAGCPVVSSNTSSMPEVVRDAGEYFDPINIDEMQNAIEKVVFSNTLQKDLIALGYKNIEHFSWQKCARETLTVYKELTCKV
jgi:glycosyltransferase involved in cell wall biosynthesis